jgi:PRC-barrel domain
MAMEDKEFGNLIGSDKVEGTTVYGADGEAIGSIERVMIDKVSGKVSYAVLAFGGILGIGSDYYPLAWSSLRYNMELGGYQTDVTQDQLKGAPHYAEESDWDWNDPNRIRAVDDYYALSTGRPGTVDPVRRI